MKKAVLLLVLTSLTNYSFCQMQNYKEAVHEFMLLHGEQIIGYYAHPSCDMQGFNVQDNGSNDFTVTVYYIDTHNNNSTFACDYDLRIANKNISNLRELRCGSNDLRCFGAVDGLLALGKGFYEIYNDANQNKDAAKSTADNIEDFLKERLSKKIKSLTASDYCYGNLYFIWVNRNYQNYKEDPLLKYYKRADVSP